MKVGRSSSNSSTYHCGGTGVQSIPPCAMASVSSKVQMSCLSSIGETADRDPRIVVEWLGEGKGIESNHLDKGSNSRLKPQSLRHLQEGMSSQVCESSSYSESMYMIDLGDED